MGMLIVLIPPHNPHWKLLCPKVEQDAGVVEIDLKDEWRQFKKLGIGVTPFTDAATVRLRFTSLSPYFTDKILLPTELLMKGPTVKPSVIVAEVPFANWAFRLSPLRSRTSPKAYTLFLGRVATDNAVI